MKTNSKKAKFMMAVFSMVLLLSTTTAFAVDATGDSYGKILAEYQVITGYNGDLMEDKDISRVEMIAIISKLYPVEFKAFTPPTIASFDDVPVNHWGYKYVEFAYEKGITSGKSARLFGVSDAVNYNQVSIFLIKALGFDVSGIQYKSAASKIAQSYGLNLLIPTDDTQMLLRSDVFELLVKALLMEDAGGVIGFEMLTSQTQFMDAFIDRAHAVINTPVEVYVGDGFFNIYYANGDLYTGEFDGELPHGNGVLNFADGNLYIGQFDRGIFKGYGIMIWPEGDYYEGEWANEAYNGLGTYTFLDGSYQYGEWADDLLIKPINQVTPEQINAGTASATKSYVVNLMDSDGKPLSGIALVAVDETNGVNYNLISNTNGNVTVPKSGEFAIIRLSLGDNSAYRFAITNDSYMVTTVGTYKEGVTFKLIK